MKKMAVLLAVLMLVCTLASCAVISGPEKTHEVFELSITMQGNFVRQSGAAYGANVILSTPPFASPSTVWRPTPSTTIPPRRISAPPCSPISIWISTC